METKRMITGMVLAMTVILGYNLFVNWLWKRNNWQAPADTPATQVANATPSTLPVAASTTGPSASITTAPSADPGAAAGLRVVSEDPGTAPVQLGSAADHDKLYAMQVQINPQSAGV